jgi:hypothetical protein
LLDERWLYIETWGGLAVEGPPHPGLERITATIGDDDDSPFDHLVFGTSGEEVIELDERRLRLEIVFTHEGESSFEGPWSPLEEPIALDLEIPYTTCE